MTKSDGQTAARPAKRLSQALSALCLVLMIGSPLIALLIYAFMPGVVADGIGLPAAEQADAQMYTAAQRIVIVLVGMLPVAFIVYALLSARRCFQSFIRGDYFKSSVVRSLRGLAAGIVLWVLAQWLTTPLLSLLLTLGTDEYRLTVRFSQNGLLTLLFAGIVWQIADILTRAVELAEENAQFV